MPTIVATTFAFLSFLMAIVWGFISYCGGIGRSTGSACDDLKSRLSVLEREKEELVLSAQEREISIRNETAYWKDKWNSLEKELELSRRENQALVHTNEVNEMIWNEKINEKGEQLRKLKEVADEKSRIKDQTLTALTKQLSETNNALTRERENGRLMRDSSLKKQQGIEALRQSLDCSHQVLAIGKQREELNKEKELFEAKEKSFEAKVSELETEKKQLLQKITYLTMEVRRFQKDETIARLSHLENINEMLQKDNLDCQRRLQEKDRSTEQFESVAKAATEAMKRNALLAEEINETRKMIEDVKHSLQLERKEFDRMKIEESNMLHEMKMSLSESLKANAELQEYLQKEKGELVAQKMACAEQLQKVKEILQQEKSKLEAAFPKMVDIEEEKSKMEAAKDELEKKLRREMFCLEQHKNLTTIRWKLF
ncbi:golgin subfamily A member 6-like protein 1 [Macrobrachium rosenbergii]|uniref:golgin subfamily A member 6-like protein 1 n=1 Tax=Macrobrachium rosenbergii TaxID=79674 RepID=UPI0034D5902C